MKYKEFNYEEAIKNIGNVYTRNGEYQVEELYKLNSNTHKPIVAVMKHLSDNRMFTETFFLNGHYFYGDEQTQQDLVIKQEELKLIDWDELPENALIRIPGGGIVHFCSIMYGLLHYYKDGSDSTTNIHGCMCTDKAEVFKNPNFTFWGGGKCPVPEGVLIEYITRLGVTCRGNPLNSEWTHNYKCPNSDVIVYRIIGVEEGYSPFFNGNEF